MLTRSATRTALTPVTITARDADGYIAPLTETIVSMVLRHLGLVPSAALAVPAGSLGAHCDVAHFDRLTEGRATVRCCDLRVSVDQDFHSEEPAWA